MCIRDRVKEAEEKGKKHKCKDYVIIGDPGTELKKISLDEFYKNFTGVLLLMKMCIRDSGVAEMPMKRYKSAAE